jgi:hypothetical protein
MVFFPCVERRGGDEGIQSALFMGLPDHLRVVGPRPSIQQVIQNDIGVEQHSHHPYFL